MVSASESTGLGYTRVVASLACWDGDADPQRDPPTRTIESVEWLTPTGRTVTSERQIQRLEARYQRRFATQEG